MKLTNREPYAAGRFYSGNSDQLLSDVRSLFENAVEKKVENNPVAIICPHAGYVFSGEVAASSIKQIDPNKQFANIFIIGSSHSTSFNGASVYSIGNYNTPLGEVKVNIELANKLIKESNVINFYPEAHKYEHSLEVEIPLLQYYFKNSQQIVPIVLGTQSIATIKKIAEALKPYFNEDNLFLISTDFSHYPDYEGAKLADQSTAEAITENDPQKLLNVLNDNENKHYSGLVTSLCGWTSVLALLYITQDIPDLNIDLIQYKNSGDSPYGEKDRVVGYCSIVFSKKKMKDNPEKEFDLNQGEKKELLKIARSTIEGYINSGNIYNIEADNLSGNLKLKCGAFVTLHKEGALRGCIGRFNPDDPLYKVVQDMAIAAATQDYRFARVEKEEVPLIEIEISVLTPLKKIKSIDEFELGKHGIYIKKGASSGTFLPQVATGTKWDKEEFLGHCAQDKAGIGWYGWKNADLYTYEAIIFSEKEFKEK